MLFDGSSILADMQRQLDRRCPPDAEHPAAQSHTMRDLWLSCILTDKNYFRHDLLQLQKFLNFFKKGYHYAYMNAEYMNYIKQTNRTEHRQSVSSNFPTPRRAAAMSLVSNIHDPNSAKTTYWSSSLLNFPSYLVPSIIHPPTNRIHP